MGRTFHPKYSSYFGDGSGRDKGIIMNDGGSSKVDRSYFMSEVFRNTYKDHGRKPLKDAVSFTYYSDGSGRDSYVI